MADPRLEGNYPAKGLYQALAVAAMCLQDEASTRPLICDVVTALEYLAMPWNETGVSTYSYVKEMAKWELMTLQPDEFELLCIQRRCVCLYLSSGVWLWTLWLSDFIRPVESSVYRELVLLVETFTTRMEGQCTRNLIFFRNKFSQQWERKPHSLTSQTKFSHIPPPLI